MIYSPVGSGGLGGGLITSHKEERRGAVLQEDKREGTDRGRKREGECVEEREGGT